MVGKEMHKSIAKLILGLVVLTISMPSMAASTSKISTSMSLGYAQGFDEFSHGYQTGSLSISYDLSKDYVLSSGIGYEYRISEYEDNTDPAFQLNSTTIWLRNENFVETTNPNDIKVSAGVALVAPTSRAAQLSSLRAGIIGEINPSKNVLKYNLNLSMINRLYLYNHEFETSDKFGYVYNSQMNFMNGILVIFQAKPGLHFTVSGLLVNSVQYSGARFSTQIYEATISYKFNKKVSVSASGTTKDRLVSDNDLLDDDNSQFGVGLSYSF